MVKNIENIFLNIERKMKKDIIGQGDFIHNLCQYFYEKMMTSKEGVLLLKGERGTFKKAGVRMMAGNLKEAGFLEAGIPVEINLGEYNFNLGYNAFLTDFNEAVSTSCSIIMFKNLEKADGKILDFINNIEPEKDIILNCSYEIKNRFLVETESLGEECIKEIHCGKRFFIFILNEDKEQDGDRGDINLRADDTIYTKPFTYKEKEEVLRSGLLRAIGEIEEEYGVVIQLEALEYLEENFRDSTNFGISEYISYKVYNPIINLIKKEQIKAGVQLLIYIKEDDIYLKSEDEVYKLSLYMTPTLEEARYKLESIIGVKELKEFMSNVENSIKVQRIREKLGLTTSKLSINMIFLGNAGTGKTEAARITFEYLNALGILSKGIFKEVSKADFVAENQSDVAKKTMEVINSAVGGVLFIDEAYSLCEGEDDRAGKEIVDALLKGIEDNRNDLVVILAGYEKDMERFLSINQGLRSRFSNIIHFLDYTPAEMYEIAVNIAKSKGYKIARNVKESLIDLFTRNQLGGKNDLGNARFVRNIVENAIMDASKKYLSNGERKIDLLERDNFNFKVNSRFNLEEKLSEIIGLEEVKNLLRSQYKLIIAQEKRKSVGINTKIQQNLNMVFTGNPGTGKTSVARLVAEMLNSMGLLKVGQLVETDRSSFVSEIPGETVAKTERKFKEALGGVLFIDEAYTLANDSLGIEVIEMLLKLIEDYSGEVVVILAGYEEEMESFFDVNIGLRSRFPLWTHFADYNPKELLEMAVRIIESNGFKLSKGGFEALRKSLIDIYENSDAQSGNGRMVRNYVEKLIRNQSIRIAEADTSLYELNRITATDIQKISIDEYDNDFSLEDKLKKLVGSEKSKQFLRNQYKQLKVRQKRRKLGLKTDINRYFNIVFTGESGTGKRTVIGILSEMYYSMGLVKAKNIVEIDKYEIMSMVSEGRSIDDILAKHLGKVIFIDKAGFLVEESQCNKIIAELIRFIDNNRNRCVIVLSGDRERMKKLVLLNQALNYRFPIWFDFEGYDYEGLCAIALETLKRKGFILDNGAEEELEKSIINLYGNQSIVIKNGLMINQYLDNLIRVQSIRVCDENVNIDNINRIIVCDIKNCSKEFLDKNTLK